MREITFTRLNKDRWVDIEEKLSNKTLPNAEVLSTLYIQLSDDLAYAQTYYPTSQTTAYLNGLTLKVHQHIHTAPKYNWSSIWHFFVIDYPLLLAKHQKYILISAIIFIISVIIGAFSAANDASFVRLILSDAYVNTTLSNIEDGYPLGIYQSMDVLPMFFSITLNNIKVALMAFGTGISLGLGTGFILFKNGVMLGAFQYFFAEQNLLWQSVSGIWMHGCIEIFSIVISGAAGLILGSSILFPKTYTRLYAFQKAAIDGVKIVMGLIPLFIVAGFIESFLTRHYTITWLSTFIIVISLAFIVFYFFIYPYYINKNHEKPIKP